MRYAVLSDIHANLEALDSVLARVDALGTDEIVCLGDLVGYNADPNACVERLRARGVRCIVGNHDLAAVGRKDPDGMWEVARRAVVWTAGVLTEENRQSLLALPGTLRVRDHFVMTHGALHEVENPEDVYLETEDEIRKSLVALAGGGSGIRVGFFGHTHHAAAYRLRDGRVETISERSFDLDPVSCYLINPGSVGVPRTGPREASFVLFDQGAGSVEFHGVPYDAAATRRKSKRHGLLRHPWYRRLASKVARRAGRMLHRRSGPGEITRPQ